ncbi:MAG: PfkB family carbohydrate kinase [Gemmatimonadales bacterium]
MRRVGVLGTMIWDSVTGRDGPGTSEEWGGIGYSLAALDAALPGDWRVVPLVKVGRDLAPSAARFLKDIGCVVPGGRFVEVPAANPCVSLRYEDLERRRENLTGGVPPWTWEELGPMLLGLDAVYANYITGFETDLATMQSLRHAFKGPIYGDLHSLALGIQKDGTRYLRPLEEALAWLTCFDVVQLNEDEMNQLGPEPLALAALALERGASAVCVTLGPRGTVYVAQGDFAGLGWAGAARPQRGAGASLVKTALIAPEDGPVEGDPTGCGDVFGGTMVAQLLKGAPLEAAIRAANRAARLNVTYRGATGLQTHLRGALQTALA